ncbi:malate dehydrogenase [candidate division KSB3 bacterium]|uniref:Malate dehydrogenase n=1 Tax=candidate division KSB3 bacterium TaxID=2044937 RepID=A0A9D5JTR9_9BACT|nr:malate dehydrogenase [candidate division KSB3 bacterium]MBD3324084.1 malate dehydrogenase [candidate division KSB3 bacterium]
MAKVNWTLENLNDILSESLTEEQIAKAKTLFLKRLAEQAHRFYGGKMQTVPKAGVFGFNWFNVWYTPGVSKISTTIRDNNETSYELSNRGNYVAVVSDSTRVLGDGNCTPPGGLGVMEGKSFLMKYLGGIDATALCVDSRNANGEHDPDKIIDFVKMVQPSFGAINLEDISQPNCYKVLDTLREACDIPVWHDDAQGTACVTLAGLINALKIAEKPISEVKMVLLGAGASNTTIARIIIEAGGDPKKMIMFDSKGALHRDRKDLEADARFYRKWELCEQTNPNLINGFDDAMKGADVLIALSKPGPGVVKPESVSLMADKSIVFACANPVPEIYPYAAKEAGAFIVATGRGDFPNQVNNSVGFPGILKGALLVRSKGVSDGMAIAAAESLAQYAENRGINENNIIATMEEAGVFPHEAADVAMQAIKEGLARVEMTRDEAYAKADADINQARELTHSLIKQGFIKQPPQEMLQEALDWAINEVS